MFVHVPFSSMRCKAASHLFANATKDGCAVLTGAVLSLSCYQCYQVMYEGEVSVGCSLCGAIMLIQIGTICHGGAGPWLQVGRLSHMIRAEQISLAAVSEQCELQ